MSHTIAISNFVLYAERSLSLRGHCRISGGDVGVRSVTSRECASQLRIGAESAVDPDYDIIAPSVSLGNEVQTGLVWTDALVDDDIQLGAVAPFPAAAMPSLPLASAPAAGNQDVTVPAGQADSLPPGNYGDLRVFGSAVLHPGTYVFSSVTIGHRAHLVCVGTAEIVIVRYLTAGRESRMHPLFDGAAGQLTISVAGTDESTGRPVVSFAEHAEVTAVICAPHGQISLASHAKVTGALAGFDIRAGDHVTVSYQSGLPVSKHGSQQLAGAYGVPPGPGTARLAGPVPADTILSLAIGLPVRDPEGLEALLHDVADPRSPRFRQHISQATFYETYGATGEDYEAVRDWAGGQGLVTMATYPNNLLLSVEATAAQVQQALYVNLRYRRRDDGSTFVTTDRAPSLDLSVPLLEITGLGDAVLPHPMLNGTGAGGTYRAADLRNAYLGVGSPHQALDGAGQVVGIVDFATFDPADITGYDALQLPAQGQPALPPANVTVVAAEGGNPAPDSTEEATVDVELVYAMAPAASILLFQGSSGITGHLDDILHAMATSNPALTVASCSLGFGASGNAQQALSEMAAQGVSFFTASGDSGDIGTGDPGNLAMNYQTLVGGTILRTNPLVRGLPAPVYPDPYYAGDVTCPASGGGVMHGTPIPDYQKGIMALSAAVNGGSTVYRNFPDVAMPAQGPEVFFGGQVTFPTGTSLSAPLWAGFTALVNQESQKNGAGLAGFLNPVLYDIGLTRGTALDLYAQCFNDVADGAGNKSSAGAGFVSVPGYDLVTGLGTPTSVLIDQLASMTPLSPDQPLSLIRFVVTTGADDLGGGLHGSSATADVFLHDGSSFTVTLREAGQPHWDNGSTHVVDFSVPASVNPPLTPSNGIAGVRVNLVQPNPGYSADNWDIANLAVSLFNPGQPQVCQLNLIGSATLQDGSTGLIRLSQSADSSGSGPGTPVYKTGAGSGC